MKNKLYSDRKIIALRSSESVIHNSHIYNVLNQLLLIKYCYGINNNLKWLFV